MRIASDKEDIKINDFGLYPIKTVENTVHLHNR